MQTDNDRITGSRAALSAFRLILVITALMLSGGCTTPGDDEPVITANDEELHGAWDEAGDDIAAFKGIPFAEPPVEDLRWRAPVVNHPRTGPQDATKFAPACMQTDYMTVWYAQVVETFGSDPELAARPTGVSEACLYLNVWAPLPVSDSALPVMIWVHGGSNKGGWSYEPNYLGGNLAKKGVVVVTVAYRLGAFGFFSHPALDNGADEPVANFGILDIAMAVQWVRDHIGQFGGNPENITLMGESAGAGNISDMTAMELPIDPGFNRMILQSSASGLGERRTLAGEQATGQRLIGSLGIEGEISAERLRRIPAEDILAASMSALPGHYFNAVIDGLTMRRSPLDNLRRGGGKDLDVLIGTNADEWYMYIDENASRADLESFVLEKAPAQASTILAELDPITDVRHAIDRVRAADNMHCPSRYLAANVTQAGGHGWLYSFTRQRPGPGGEKLGAYHGTEIPYVFGMHDDWLPVDDLDAGLTDAVMDYWVQFARTGDPNISTRPPWPVFDRQNAQVMELGDNIGAIAPTDTRLCEILGPE